MVGALDSGTSGLGSNPVAGLLHCVLGQDTLLSVPLSTNVLKGYRGI